MCHISVIGRLVRDENRFLPLVNRLSLIGVLLSQSNTYFFDFSSEISIKTEASQHPRSLLLSSGSLSICIALVQHTAHYTVVQPGMRAVISEIIGLLDYMTTQCQCQQCLIHCYQGKHELAKYCLFLSYCHCH